MHPAEKVRVLLLLSQVLLNLLEHYFPQHLFLLFQRLQMSLLRLQRFIASCCLGPGNRIPKDLIDFSARVGVAQLWCPAFSGSVVGVESSALESFCCTIAFPEVFQSFAPHKLFLDAIDLVLL